MLAELGQKIRQIRQERGLKGGELAKAAGFSASYISQIERGKITPSVPALVKVAVALGVPATALFEQPERPASDLAVLRRHERPVISYPGSPATYEILVAAPNGLLGPSLCTIPPGEDSGEEPFVHEGEQWGIVLEGVIEYRVGNKEYTLEPGDAIRFDSSVPHWWRNPGPEPARAIWVETPPYFLTRS